MLVDENGIFLTQRILPMMALFKISLIGDLLFVHFNNEFINIPVAPPDQPGKTVQIWDDTVTAHEVGDTYNEWFSSRLNVNCKLVYFPESNPRPVDPKYKVNDEQVSLADAYPFLIIGQSSLDDLNGRLKEALPMNRFRPNFVFTGGTPFEEDTWRNFSIGSNRFIGIKPCARCAVPTINQETAEKGIEPTRTLATYRAWNNKIHFGQNLVALDHTQVYEGDVIRVESFSPITK
jgi:uncharacterized protein YcbX